MMNKRGIKMNEQVTLSDLIESLMYCTDKTRDLKKQREEYEGYEFGYWYSREIDATAEAQKEFGAKLDAYILQRIRAMQEEETENAPTK